MGERGWRLPLLIALCGIGGALLARTFPPPALHDWLVLERWGSQLVDGDLRVFIEDPKLNVGPLALIAAGLIPSWTVASAFGAALLPAVVWCADRHLRDRALAAVAVAAFPWTVGGFYGHIDDQMATALLVAGATSGSGLTVGLAAAAKPWALGCVGALQRRHSLVAVAVFAASLVPFVAADSESLSAGQTMVGVQDGSPLHLFTDELPPWWRFLQLAAMIAVAWRLRCDPLSAVAASIAVRLLLDPGDFPYYAAAVAGVGAAVAARGGSWLTVAASWPLLLAAGLPGELWVRTGALCVLLVAARSGRGGRNRSPAGRVKGRAAAERDVEPLRERRTAARAGRSPRRGGPT